MRKLGILVTAALAVVVLAVAGCGSDDSGDATTTEAETPTRGFNVGDAVKSGCQKLGGNFNFRTTQCVFESSAVCVNGTIRGAANLNGFRCVVDPAAKAALDAADAQATANKQYELIAELGRARDECEDRGAPWEWLEGANYCIQTKPPNHVYKSSGG